MNELKRTILLVIILVCWKANLSSSQVFDQDCKDGLQIYEDQKNPILTFTVVNPNEMVTLATDGARDFFDIAVEGLKGEITVIQTIKNIQDKGYPQVTFTVTSTLASTPKPATCTVYFTKVNWDSPVIIRPSSLKVQFEENKMPEASVAVTSFDVRDPDWDRDFKYLKLFAEFEVKDEDDPEIRKHFKLMVSDIVPNSKPKIRKVSLHLIKPLDYESQNNYNLDIIVKDETDDRGVLAPPAKTDSITLIFNVLDQHDQFPQFTKECGYKTIPENTKVGQEVLKVKATDGDTGVKGSTIKYTIKPGVEQASNYFTIKEDGSLVIKKSPDREGIDFADSTTITFDIIATEYDSKGKKEPVKEIIETQCVIKISDVDDSKPLFNKKKYSGSVKEHAKNAIIQMNDEEHFINDLDEGANAEYFIELVNGDGNLFLVKPISGTNKVVFEIEVNNHDFDYDGDSLGASKSKKFKIKSKGKLNAKMNDEAEIEVEIEDINDQIPEFVEMKEIYEIEEHCGVGTLLTELKATDKDTFIDFGTKSIRYKILSNALIETFKINSISGLIDVKNGVKLDREKTPEISLSVEAADYLGASGGNKKSAELTIKLLDINDQRPIFRIKKLRAVFYENKETFEDSIQVEADDADEEGNPNSKIKFKLRDFIDFFKVQEDDGIFLLNGGLDFEANEAKYPTLDKTSSVYKRQFIVKIYAHDLGTKPKQLTSEIDAIVTVDFIDVNDETPIFDETLCPKIISINETDRAGTIVYKVTAKDSDLSKAYNTVSYSLLDENASGHFTVNRNSGELGIAQGADLRPEENSRKDHSIIVQASDGERSTSKDEEHCRVTIKVLDINNQKPNFVSSENSEVNVEEEMEESFLVKTFAAFDPDEDNELEFSIDFAKSRAETPQFTTVDKSHYDYTKIFEIDKKSGDLTVTKVDREELNKMSLVIQVYDAKEVLNKPQIDTTTIVVHVTDINDNSPVFVNANNGKSYSASIEEHQNSSNLLRIEATDKDLDNIITYELEHGTISEHYFKINITTGIIEVFGNIDYDKGVEYHSISFKVVATDNGIPPRSSTADVQIKIIDKNDNNPIFEKEAEKYHLQIPENTTVKTIVEILKATDLDSGDFGLVHYRMNSKLPDSKYFAIDQISGNFSILQELDYESEMKRISPSVEAYDNPFKPDNSLTTILLITVDVLDINDNAPVFTNNFTKCTEILEDVQVGHVHMVKASDADQKDTDNSRIEFSIIEGNEKGLFRVDDVNGNVFLEKSVLNDLGKKIIKFKAEDFGDPRLSSTTDYCFDIKDINNNHPIFEKPKNDEEPPAIPFYEGEKTKIGTLVYTVFAKDADLEKNGEVNYRLIGETISETFSINRTNGEIKTLKLFKKERITSKNEYLIEIEAYDLGDVSLKSEKNAHIRVLVKSELDEKPHFKEQEQNRNVSFKEHSLPGNETVQLPRAAFNPDYHEEAPSMPICHHLIGKNAKLFKLDVKTSQLTVATDLDREIEASYEITIWANSVCDAEISEEPNDYGRPDILNVNVHLEDINDNPPIFKNKPLTAGIPSTGSIRENSVILTALAIDADEGENAVVRYSVFGDIMVSGGDNLQVDPNTVFVIDENSGAISITITPAKNMKAHFNFMVKAEDIDHLNDTVQVLIYLMREDQQIVLTIGIKVSEVNKQIRDDFSKILFETTKHYCNIDTIRASSTQANTYSTRKMYSPEKSNNYNTDLLVHFVNPTTNTILEPDEAVKLVIQHYDAIKEATRKNNYVLIDAKKNVVDSSNDDALSAEQIKYMLIGAAAFLLITLAVAVTIFLIKINGLKRNLKAASATAFGSQNSGLNRMGVVSAPNTNQHMVEGSNPMWGQHDEVKYQPEDNDSETASLSSFGEANSLAEESEARKNPAFIEDDDPPSYSIMVDDNEPEKLLGDLEMTKTTLKNPKLNINTLRDKDKDWRRRATQADLGLNTISAQNSNILKLFSDPDKRRASAFVPSSANFQPDGDEDTEENNDATERIQF